MKIFVIFFVFCLILIKSEAADSSTAHIPPCVHKLNSFAVKTGLFFQCTIQHSQPIIYCSKCVYQFYNLTQSYYNLTTFMDGTNCRDRYFDLDRINVIETTYSQAWDLWNKGICSDCYYWPNQLEEPVLSNTTTEFFHFHKDWLTCTNMFYGTACVNCLGKYNHLNAYYIEYQKIKSAKVCYDMQDQINKTRLFWSKEMSCCKDKKSSLVSFTFWSSAFCLIVPFVFYGGFIWTTIKNERNRYISAEDPASDVTSSSENRSTREAPDTDSTYIDILKKTSKLDESDDEIAGYSPKNLKIVDDSDDELLGEDSPKKSKRFNNTEFDDGAGPSNSKINKKSKNLKKPSKPSVTRTSKDLVDL